MGRREVQNMILDFLHWVLLPISGATQHEISMEVSWHGRLMVIAWSMLVPIAVLIARFFKVLPNQPWPQELDNKFWWHRHRLMNYTAALLTAYALALIWGSSRYSGDLRDLHAFSGMSVCILTLLQIFIAHFRGSKGGPTDQNNSTPDSMHDLSGDHYDMTLRRIIFEYLHKSLGYLALLMGMGTVALGLFLADAPRWMCLGLSIWWLGFLVFFVHLQNSGRCVDTYQAIWGPDIVHPGNRRKPIGWGIHRKRISHPTTIQDQSK